jgi:ADP-heptose:LPS heptosyltransferase
VITGNIVISPFSNSSIRDWPLPHFKSLIELIESDLGIAAEIVGTKEQREVANILVRGRSSVFVQNSCGNYSWTELSKLIQTARLVIANNSGVAHLAATEGTPTICLFGGSHSLYEWMPRGPRVVVLAPRPSCSPCAKYRLEDCPYAQLCLRSLSPNIVFTQVKNLIHLYYPSNNHISDVKVAQAKPT